MSDEFWRSLPAILGAVGAFCTLLYQMWSKHESRQSRAELKEEVSELMQEIRDNTEMTQAIQMAATRSKAEIDRAALGGERKGAVEALVAERRRTSGWAPLRPEVDIQVGETKPR